MSDGDIATDMDDAGIAWITLTRPAMRNALRREGLEALREVIDGFAADERVRALVLTGSGGAFCAGADLLDPMMGTDLAPEQQGAQTRKVIDELMNPVIRGVRDAPFPTIAAVNGVVAGGGVGLALAADITIAQASARFVLTFTPMLGLVPDLGSTWHLARHLGRARALGLTLTGEPLGAEEAAAVGLIWKTVPDEALQDEVADLALRFARGPARGQVAARRLVDAAFVNDFDAQLDAERDMQASLSGGAEPVEAMRAFAEKRRPDFTVIPRAEQGRDRDDEGRTE